MSHLTLAGRRCKVGEKRYKCIFHSKRSSKKVTTSRGQRRISSGGKRGSSQPVPWYISMSGPQKRKIQAALRLEEEKRAEYAGPIPAYVPRWGGTRKGSRPKYEATYLPRSERFPRRKRYTKVEFMRDFDVWMEEMSRKGGFMDVLR